MQAWVKRPDGGSRGSGAAGSAASYLSLAPRVTTIDREAIAGLASIAPRDVDDALGAAAARDGDGFVMAAWHVGMVRRRDHRRKAMGPVPGDVIGGGVTDVVRGRRRDGA